MQRHKIINFLKSTERYLFLESNSSKKESTKNNSVTNLNINIIFDATYDISFHQKSRGHYDLREGLPEQTFFALSVYL
ncbi:Uncharacterised protein [uncultured archaeon]|nr:Uncharacterised protein [uncultured archaeon]